MRALVLARPRLPSLRAQSVQIVHAAHALASRGVEVTLCHEDGGMDALTPYGLAPLPTLRLIRLPADGTAASLAFRAHVAWAARRVDVVLARGARYAASFVRAFPRVPLVFEAHEVGSIEQLGRSDGELALGLERRVLNGARALICNCEGVRDALGWLHRLPALTAVVHNASAPRRLPAVDGRGFAYAGSLIPGKDLDTLARAAPALGGVTVFGAHSEHRFAALQALASGALVRGGPVDPQALPDRLAAFRTLILPLGDGWFGRELTSPLKAFAYLAAGVPFVGADTPALHRAAPGAFLPYRSGDRGALVDAARRVADDEPLRARLLANARPRTWEARAAEVHAVLDAVC